MQAAVIGIIALLIGVGVGYLSRGEQATKVANELSAARAQLAAAEQAAVREGQVATKIQAIEAELKQVTQSLRAEQEARAKLEKLAAPKKR